MANSKTTEHKEGKASIRVVYYTSKTLSDGAHPFLICITKDRKRKYIATGLSLLPVFWDSSKSNYRDAIKKPTKELVKRVGETFDREKLVADLAEWEAKYKGAATILAEADEQYDAPDVAKKAVEGRAVARRSKLLAYVDKLIGQMRAGGKVGNADVYADLRNTLIQFIAAKTDAPAPPMPAGRGKGKADWEAKKKTWEARKAAWVDKHDIPFSQVTVSFCNDLERRLKARKVAGTTLSLRFRTLRTVCSKAIEDKVMTAGAYPFSRNSTETGKYQVGKHDISTKARAISREELTRLEALTPATDRHQLAKDVFLFSYYGAGINFVDLAQLRWENITTGSDSAQRLTYERQKTGGKFDLTLHVAAAVIVAKYRPFTFTSPSGYVFPILDLARHKTPQQIGNRLHKMLGEVNGSLKELAVQVGISTPLTTYVARHTMATVLKLAGHTNGEIGQIMGHRNEATTEIYLKKVSTEVLDAAIANSL